MFLNIPQNSHLCQSFFFNTIAVLTPATLFKRSLWDRYFPVNFAKFSATPFFTEQNQAKMINFIIYFHTQRELFFRIKFHPGMKSYSFHPGMKLTCKQKFFHRRTSFIPGWDFISVTCKRALRTKTCRFDVSAQNW